MPGREYTPAELAEDIHEMQRELRAMREVLERTYIRQDVYEAHRAADQAEVSTLRDQLVGFRLGWRTILGQGALPVIVGLVVGLLMLALGGR